MRRDRGDGLESGTYVVDGLFSSLTRRSTTRLGREGQVLCSHATPETKSRAGQLTIEVETRPGADTRVSIGGATIELMPAGRSRLMGSGSSGGAQVQLEIEGGSVGGRLVFHRVTETERVVQKRLGFANAFTGEKWDEYIELKEQITEEVRFVARVQLWRPTPETGGAAGFGGTNAGEVTLPE
ncbi:MAG: hypothetical protein IT384_28900 [Deltaproteobacteria bacterium]|nr:hypothetical protein [Deltaproteobacteria bacterium]